MKFLLITRDDQLAAIVNCTMSEQGHELTATPSFDEIPAEMPPESFAAVWLDRRGAADRVVPLARRARYLVVIGDGEQTGEILESFRRGACDYLPLPLTEESLREALERWKESVHEVLATLEYRNDAGEEVSHALHRRSNITLGRDTANDVAFGSQVVSRRHARVWADDENFLVSDLDSRHGVFVGDRRLHETVRLRDGDCIRLGKSTAPTLTFRAIPSAKPDEAPPSDLAETSLLVDPNREFKELASLLDTFLNLRQDLVLEDVLSLVVTHSMEFADAERGLILLTEDESGDDSLPIVALPQPVGHLGRLKLAVARNRDGSAIDSSELAISQKIPEEVLNTGKGVIAEDLLTGERAQLHMNTIDLGVRSAMCVPLRARRPGTDAGEAPSLIGVLYVDSGARSRAFSDRLLHALESLANEASRAIINAQLYEVSLKKRHIDEEMSIARRIQENLLPAEHYECDWVELHGTSEPSLEVGGDIINYYPHGDDCLGLLVGDVSGKGIAAAIFSAMLDGHFLSLSSLPDARKDPGRFAGDLNRYLLGKSQGQKFVSFLFGVLHRTGRFVYVNAGHNPALHVDDAGEVSLLKTGGMIMGLLEEARYETGEVTLKPGDSLVLYSDGITETRNPRRDLYSLDRLQETAVDSRRLTAEEAHRAILESVEQFSEGSRATDDVTLLVVKKT